MGTAHPGIHGGDRRPLKASRWARGWLSRGIQLGLLTLALDGRAQTLDGPATGVSYADVDRQTGRRRSLLRFGSVEPAGENLLQVNRVLVEFYGEPGVTNAIVTADGCRYDTQTRQTWSPGRLKVVTGNGQVEIEGLGFRCSAGATNSLVISNEVRAVVDRSAMGGTNLLEGARAVVPRGVGREGARAPLVIRSREFYVTNDVARFVGDVVAEDPLGTMRCRVLTLQAEAGARRLTRLLASGEVRVVSDGREATAEEAAYQLDRDELELTGRPTWRGEGRSGQADRCVLDRARNSGRAEGNVEMEIAAEALSLSAVMGPAGSPAGVATNGPVRVWAGWASFGVDPAMTNQNLLVFGEKVRVTEGEGTMTCRLLTLRAREPGNVPVGAQAEGEVEVRQGAAEVTAAKATFDVAADTVTFTGDPRWRMEDRSGAAERLIFEVKRKLHRADGGVTMEAPAGMMAARRWMLSGAGGGRSPTNGTPAKAAAANAVRIRSDAFEYVPAAAAGGGDTAVYRGGVEVKDGEGATLTCEEIRVELDPVRRAARQLVAERNVEIDLVDKEGRRSARGDRLRYDAGRDEVELTGKAGVMFVFVDQRGESRARGQRAVYRVGQETLTLLGNPVLEAPEGRFSGDQVRLDRRTGKAVAGGYWRARLPFAGASKLELPDDFKVKQKP